MTSKFSFKAYRLPAALLVAWALLFPLSAGSAQAAPGTIESITVQGLFRMTPAAFRHALEIEEGDAFDRERILTRYRYLWDLGLFNDITISAEDAPEGGKALIIVVEERPVLTSVTYEDNKVATRTQIEDALAERKMSIELGKPLDRKQLGDVAAAIRDLLGSKGHLDSAVDYRVERATETSRSVYFTIKPGRKTRIREIQFTGNEVFKDRQLKDQLELTQEYQWYWPWSQKNLYHPLKWDQDVGKIRELYQNWGYLDVELRAPVVEVLKDSDDDKKKKKKRRGDDSEESEETATADANGVAANGHPVADGAAADSSVDDGAERPSKPKKDPARKQRKKLAKIQERLDGEDLDLDERQDLLEKKSKIEKKIRKKEANAESPGRRWVRLVVPVVEGEQYKVGDITFSGNSVLTEDQVRSQIPLAAGGIFNNGALDFGVDVLSRSYANKGHLYANVVRRIQRREDEAVADVHIEIDEDEPYYVDHIEFVGNTSTQDRVLRREVQLIEGQLFNRSAIDLSRIKLNQLGYVLSQEDPVVEPVEGEQRVNVKFAVQEQGRNEIQIGGGYSGIDGAFFSGVYSTRNFLGRGQVLSTALQIGGRSNRYQLSFTEPWFLNRPYNLGFSIFRRDVDFGDTLRSTSEGGGIIFGKLLGRFGQVQVGYNYERVESSSSAFTVAGTQLSQSASNEISSLTPVYRYNTVNNPYRPSSGTQFNASLQIAGGPLGGDTSFIKPILSYTTYKRTGRRGFMAFNSRLGFVTEWDRGSSLNSQNVFGIPRFQRFWIGGDTQGPRVFEIRTITPLRYVLLDDNGAIDRVIGDPRNIPVEQLANLDGVPVLLEVGGDRFWMTQLEWVYPFNEQVDVALFADAGDVLFEDTSFGFDTFRASAGIELRFHLPVFPVPLRLIYGVPIRKLEDDDTGAFQFSIGRSF